MADPAASLRFRRPQRSAESAPPNELQGEKYRDMETRGRKNAAGGWLQSEILDRGVSAVMMIMAFAGFAVGFAVRSLPIFDFETGVFWTVVVMVALFLSFAIFLVLIRRIDATWIPGLRAERWVGDVIEHALARPGCAFAHDVKEALGGSGNVDHVVMTQVGVWVVETKSGWLDKRHFPSAMRQVAQNVARVRRHLDTSLPVRGALIIADRWDRSLESRHEWNGEPVTAFDLETFWRLLQAEGAQAGDGRPAQDTARVEKAVWNLGSIRHLES